MDEKSEDTFNKLMGTIATTQERLSDLEKKRAAAPSLRKFLIESPLYQSVDLEAGVHDELLSQLRQEGGRGFDCYCIKCKRETPFRRAISVFRHSSNQLKEISNGFLHTVMVCQRNTDHQYVFYSQIENSRLRKVGQIPTFEDIAFGEVEKYRGVLGPKSFSELHRAGGLASFGIGIGAFVYLRRIFERMIIEHHDALVKKGKGIENSSVPFGFLSKHRISGAFAGSRLDRTSVIFSPVKTILGDLWTRRR